MSTLHAEQRRRAEQSFEVQRGLYREQLREAAAERHEYRQAAEAASRRIALLLPGAADAGVPIAEIARLTGQSRPTLYRLLAEARPQRDLAAQFAHLARGLRAASEEVGHPALLVEFASSLGLDIAELRLQLSPLFDYGVQRFDALGAPASIALIDLLPGLPEVEKIILNMTFSQRLALADIARSVDRPETDVIAWGVLGLLRVLPVIEAAESAQAAS